MNGFDVCTDNRFDFVAVRKFSLSTGLSSNIPRKYFRRSSSYAYFKPSERIKSQVISRYSVVMRTVCNVESVYFSLKPSADFWYAETPIMIMNTIGTRKHTTILLRILNSLELFPLLPDVFFGVFVFTAFSFGTFVTFFSGFDFFLEAFSFFPAKRNFFVFSTFVLIQYPPVHVIILRSIP